ncbi:uncharacterized protein LOC133909643 isoform X1 [Phragmites australis]|uniref:uncharacterized protein LOC133909643 isoform X1 n=1 Tax=Phragmites australis TaxID=29695 RepID=UPI002D779E4A|nr:uncharacterized protein LOC133909643 isoform X1 [Phragmites australis]
MILKKKPVYSMKKGQIVRVEKEKYLNCIHYQSVGHPPFYKGLHYIYKDRGEVLDIRIFETGKYALIAWVGIPTPPAWLLTFFYFFKQDSLTWSSLRPFYGEMRHLDGLGCNRQLYHHGYQLTCSSSWTSWTTENMMGSRTHPRETFTVSCTHTSISAVYVLENQQTDKKNNTKIKDACAYIAELLFPSQSCWLLAP